MDLKQWGSLADSRHAVDRITINSALIVLVFLSVLLLSSQSAASFATYLLGIAMLVCWREWLDVRHCALIWPTLGLLIYLPISSFWSDGFSWSEFASQLARGLLIFLFVVAFAECQLRGLLQRWLFTALVFTASVVSVACIAVFIWQPPVDGRLLGFGQLDAAVIAGIVFGFALIVALHQLLTHGYRNQPLVILATLPLILAVVLTGSRGAILASFSGAVTLLAAHFAGNTKRFIILCSILAGVVGVAFFVVWTNADLRAAFFPRGDSFRLVIWQETLARLTQAPWFGMGILSPDDVTRGDLVFQHPHNLFLAVAFQGGLVALLGFAWLLLGVLGVLMRNMNAADARLGLGILGLALPAYFVDGHELLDKVSDTWFLIWLPIAIALGLHWHKTY